MNTSEKKFDSKTILDLILVGLFVIGLIVYWQYSHVIDNEVAEVLSQSARNMSNSVAELESAGK
ncbi:hypothetical protein [Maribacter sp. 2210JD10-5]|uniref:hypothetical protein n=1 Tax=Maribacter sp. 2210JD10-5 TaxID=3386272 RepID=UPI0039BC44DE